MAQKGRFPDASRAGEEDVLLAAQHAGRLGLLLAVELRRANWVGRSRRWRRRRQRVSACLGCFAGLPSGGGGARLGLGCCDANAEYAGGAPPASAFDDLEDGLAMSPTFLGPSPFSRGLHIHRACIELVFLLLTPELAFIVCVF